MAHPRQAPRPRLTSLRLDDLMPHIQRNLEVEEYRGFMRRPIKNCFQAKKLVSWLHTNEISSSRVHAVEVGQQLLDEKYMRAVPNATQTDFRDGDGYYQWNDAENTETNAPRTGGSPSVRSTLFSPAACMSPSQPHIQRNTVAMQNAKALPINIKPSRVLSTRGKQRDSTMKSSLARPGQKPHKRQRAESELIRLRLKCRDLEKRLDRRNQDYMQLRREYFAFKESVRHSASGTPTTTTPNEPPPPQRQRSKARSLSTDSRDRSSVRSSGGDSRASRSPASRRPRSPPRERFPAQAGGVDGVEMKQELDMVTRDYCEVSTQMELWKRKYERERAEKMSLQKRVKEYEEQFEPRRQPHHPPPPRHLSTTSSMSTNTEPMSLANTTLTTSTNSDVPTEVSDSLQDTASILRQLRDSCAQLRTSYHEVHAMIEEHQWSVSIISDFMDKTRRMHSQIVNFVSEVSRECSDSDAMVLLNSVRDTLQGMMSDKHIANLLENQDRINEFVLDGKHLRKVFVLSTDALSLVESIGTKVPGDHMSTTSSSSGRSTTLISPRTCDSLRSQSTSPRLGLGMPLGNHHGPLHSDCSPLMPLFDHPTGAFEPALRRQKGPISLNRSQSHSPGRSHHYRPMREVSQRRR